MTTPGRTSYEHLVARILGKPDSGTPLFLGAYMSTWNASTYSNTVVGGTQTYTNLPVINPGELAVGPVLLLYAGGAPIVIGRVFRFGT